MEYTILGEKRDIALVHTDEVVLRDAASALEFMMSAQYETGCRKLILPKASVSGWLKSGMPEGRLLFLQKKFKRIPVIKHAVAN